MGGGVCACGAGERAVGIAEGWRGGGAEVGGYGGEAGDPGRWGGGDVEGWEVIWGGERLAMVARKGGGWGETGWRLRGRGEIGGTLEMVEHTGWHCGGTAPYELPLGLVECLCEICDCCQAFRVE